MTDDEITAGLTEPQRRHLKIHATRPVFECRTWGMKHALQGKGLARAYMGRFHRWVELTETGVRIGLALRALDAAALGGL